MTRRERLGRKLAKREEWAEKARARSAARFTAAHTLADQIPLGQPILVGHHSEGRARRDAERIHTNLGAGVAEGKLAEHHDSKAAGLAGQLDRSVFSDDADAIEQLTARIAEREAECERVKALNVAIRREMRAGLAEGWLDRIGATEAERAAISANVRTHWKHEPVFPAYVLANLRGRIAADRERIKAIEARRARVAGAEEAPGGVLVEGDAYVRVTFAEKPTRKELDALKAAGFRWSGGSWIGDRAKLPAFCREGARDDRAGGVP
jgi:hypothetical protein